LEERIKGYIDPSLIGAVTLSNEQDMFLNVITQAIGVLIKVDCNTAFHLMTKVDWAGLQAVGDQSEYVNMLSSQILAHTTRIARWITHVKYFRSYCDKLVE
jgi:hypothetical protein